MLAIILTTVLARGMYVQQPWNQRSEYAFNKAAVQLSKGNRVGVQKWFNRGLQAWEEAEKIQRIDLELTELVERKGLAEQLIKDRDAAIIKSEGAQAVLDAMQTQIDALTAQKKQLMDKIVGQAEKADTVAAQITADVTEQPLLKQEEHTLTAPQEGQSTAELSVSEAAPVAVEPAPSIPTDTTTEAAPLAAPTAVPELPAAAPASDLGTAPVPAAPENNPTAATEQQPASAPAPIS